MPEEAVQIFKTFLKNNEHATLSTQLVESRERELEAHTAQHANVATNNNETAAAPRPPF
ncbi:MAG: hypothetical protein HOI53_02835 [Francisellaceae bacterium]|nr:hypothetical protein [Francisellaceae bacterium]